MDTVKRKNWFKRLFILDYDVQLAPLLESIDPILENIQIQQIEIDDAHLKIDGLSEAMKVVVRQVESVDEKLNLIKTFDYQGKILYAQADLNMNASGNSDIAVSIDNVNKAAYLRFGSSEAVDTVDAVWFISKTGNKVKNDFGDELSPNAPRLTVQDFLRMTQGKQGDTPLTDLVPPHAHDNFALKDHSHGGQDLTHDHEGQYAPVHDHPYEPVHDHPYAKDEHGHSEYFPNGNAVDDDGNPLPLPYPDANSLGGAVNGKADEHGHPYVKTDADTTLKPTADNRFITLKNDRPKEEDGSYADKEFGLAIDIDEGNTWKNQFEVGTRHGFALKVLGGTGRTAWFGGKITQKGDSLENADARDYIIRKNLTDATDELATKIELEELQVEVDALATTRDAGRWTVAASAGVRPGEVHFVSSSMSTSDNLITVNDTDLNGTVHGWSNLEAGDFLEVVQETESVTKSVGSYGLFKITADNGGTGIRSMELALDQGSGDLVAGSNVFIKVFHANNDLDLAALDERYALKGHTHNTGGDFISASHGDSTFFATNENWNNKVYHFPYARGSNTGALSYGGNVDRLGRVMFKNGTEFYGKVGQTGTLIASTTDGVDNPFVVLQVFHTEHMERGGNGVPSGDNIQLFEGFVIYSRSNFHWDNVDQPLYWFWRGSAR